jgi:hypothetical protein
MSYHQKNNLLSFRIQTNTLPLENERANLGAWKKTRSLSSAPAATEETLNSIPRQITFGSNVWGNRQSAAYRAVFEPPSNKAKNLSPTQQNDFLHLEKINNPNNSCIRSSSGRTSGVFLITDPSSGTTLAALKPVKKEEIFANKFFDLLEMPIPKFDIHGKNKLSKTINDTVMKSFEGKAIHCEYQNIMVMEHIKGRPLSEHNPHEIKKCFLNEANMELVGRSMALDMFIGNADRIISFSAPVCNPDNIMVRNNSVVFIDQVFRERGSQLGKFFDSLMQSVKPGQDEDNNVYKKYMQPLVVKSLDNYAKKNEGTNKDDMLDKFNSSISHTEQSKINENIVLGIRNALQLLVDKKKEVLDLDPSRHNQINEIYRFLEKNLDGLE